MARVIPYKLKVLTIVTFLLTANIITLSILKYDKYECYLAPEEEAVQQLVTLNTKRPSTSIRTDNTLSIDFIHDNYFDVKLSYEYQIPRELVATKHRPRTYPYDPRLTLGIYLSHINSLLKGNPTDIKPIPFSWYDFIDMAPLNKFLDLPNNEKFNCETVCVKEFDVYLKDEMNKKFKNRISKRLLPGTRDPSGNSDVQVKTKPKVQVYSLPACELYCKDDQSDYQPGFIITNNLSKGKADLKTIHANSFLYSTAPNPLDLVVVTNKGNLQVPIKSNTDISDKQSLNMMNSGLFKEYTLKNQNLKINLLSTMNELYSLNRVKKSYNSINFDKYRIELEHERFVIDGYKYIKNMESSQTPLSTKDLKFKESMQYSLHRKESQLDKYFSEVALVKEPDIKGYHYDWRFFTGKKFTLDEKHAILSRMLKTWFELTANEGLISWVAHGGLLAYSFNGINFPWDDDSDVQMPLQDFVEFGRKYNGSLILENPQDGFGAYYIDVGDSFTHRVKGKGANNIDARMIDIHSGVFVDITALGVSGTNLHSRYKEDYRALKDHELKYFDPNHADDEDIIKKEMDNLAKAQNIENPNDILESLKIALPAELDIDARLGLTWDKNRTERYDINYKLKLYNCRNNHFYQLKDLSPLRLSYFEKAPVLIPNNIPKILKEEYKEQSLLTTKFNGHSFLPQLRMWVPNNLIARMKYERNKVKDLNLLEEEDILRLLKEDYILEHFNKIWDSSLLNEKERMIMRDITIKNKDELLGDLLINRRFDPIMRDPFMEKLQSQSINDGTIDESELKRKFYRKLSNELSLEYQHKIDFKNIGLIPKSNLKNDFNKVSNDLKTMLKSYKELKLDNKNNIVSDFVGSINEKVKKVDENGKPTSESTAGTVNANDGSNVKPDLPKLDAITGKPILELQKDNDEVAGEKAENQ